MYPAMIASLKFQFSLLFFENGQENEETRKRGNEESGSVFE